MKLFSWRDIIINIVSVKFYLRWIPRTVIISLWKSMIHEYLSFLSYSNLANAALMINGNRLDILSEYTVIYDHEVNFITSTPLP